MGRLAGVSRATASRVITSSRSVSGPSADRVWRAVELLGYEPDLAARALAKGRSSVVDLIVIDPRTTPLARQADIHVAVRPGTDLPVALSIHRFMFEEGHADTAFLEAHAATMPRVMLRYAIEKLDKPTRDAWLARKQGER